VDRKLRPLRLSSGWLDACDDGTCEFRLARALASVRAPSREDHKDELGPIRAHCLPLDPKSGFTQFAVASESLRKDPRVVWTGTDLPRDLSAIVLRRIMEGSREGESGIPLDGMAYALLEDIATFVNGAVDDARLARLARGFMAIAPIRVEIEHVTKPLPIYALFRAANFDAGAVTKRVLERRGLAARCDAQTVRLLTAGRLDEASRVALARLGAMGLRPKLRFAAGDAPLALRLAASLVFPIGPHAVSRVLETVTKPFDSEPSETP